jgi:hypothetical protein
LLAKLLRAVYVDEPSIKKILEERRGSVDPG